MSNTNRIIDALGASLETMTPVEWAEKNRVLSSDVTNWPGPMRYSRTPYLIEIANSIMENDPAQIISIMKGSQIGFSIGGIFTMMGWVIDMSPGNMLFMVDDIEGIKRAMQGPIDQMINSSGIGHKIRATNVRGGRNQKTGDTIQGKTFPDGNLYTWSGRKIGKLSQISVKYGFYDEFERYPHSDKKAGSPIALIEERHKSYMNTRKIYLVSTPEFKQTSNIEPMYLKGDQRKYHIPCPHCNEMIDLIWYKDSKEVDGKVGVVFERDENGKLMRDTVEYRCQKCGGSFPQTWIYDCYDAGTGQWIPTATPINNSYRSYHISALYAPAGMYNWEHYAQKWCEIYPKNKPSDLEALKTFVNQVLGQTWEVQGKSIEINNLAKNSFNYKIGMVPNALSVEHGNGEIIMLTCAVDLNGKQKDARLDYEVIAWTESGSTYSVDHGSIGTFERSKLIREGTAADVQEKEDAREKFNYDLNHTNNVWDIFTNEVLLKIYESDDGQQYRIMFCGIDTGHFTQSAYGFIERHEHVVGLKGRSDIKFTMFDTNTGTFKISKERKDLYLVETNKIKDELSQRIALTWDEKQGIDQPPGFLNYPYSDGIKYSMKYFFSHYEGEKRDLQINEAGTAIGARWIKKHSGAVNHFFDTIVYNMALKDILVDMFCREEKMTVKWSSFVSLFK